MKGKETFYFFHDEMTSNLYVIMFDTKKTVFFF